MTLLLYQYLQNVLIKIDSFLLYQRRLPNFSDLDFISMWLDFLNNSVLHAFGSIFGQPLRADQATTSQTRPSMAHILVKVDLSKRHLKEI